MTKVLRFWAFGVLAFTFLLSLPLRAQAGDPVAIQDKLNAMFKLTTTTADHGDIVTPGDVVAIRRPGLVMFAVGTPIPPTNTYKNGQISQGFGTLMELNNQDITKRRFVPGEKFWLTGASVQNDCIAFDLFSDPYDDIRYTGTLKIMFPDKKTVPSVDTAMQLVSSVLAVAGSSGQAAQPAPAQGPVPAPAPLQAIAPPPPPADQPPPPPKTIQVGQTKDVVIATLGQPSKDIKLAAKEILVYSDMKVILVAGKVSDVQ